jgi:S-methylmethionine-dependent homocysteine/selenocysteine methylase
MGQHPGAMSRSSPITILDGPMGTRLEAGGVVLEGPAWSARAVVERPDAVAAVHRAYAAAGATVHTAATFRATREALDAWAAAGGPCCDARAVVDRAVRLARSSVPTGHRVAGSVASTADCYEPGGVGRDARGALEAHLEQLARAGVDLLLLETFANRAEIRVAVEVARAIGLPVWLAVTAGHDGALLGSSEARLIADHAWNAGVEAVLVNCSPVDVTTRLLEAIAPLGGRCGAYANAGTVHDDVGWLRAWGATPPNDADTRRHAARYAEQSARWVVSGATILGGCCGTSEAHVAALAHRFSG